MTIERVVDAHVHLWDPARADWYPYLAGMQELDMGDISGMCRRFDQPTYFSEAAEWNVQKFVHVAAAAAPVLVDETRELDEQADATGHPDVLVGGLVPSDDTAFSSGCNSHSNPNKASPMASTTTGRRRTPVISIAISPASFVSRTSPCEMESPSAAAERTA